MPPCHIRNVKLVAEAELPILPFLAPRLLQPWPFARQPSSRYRAFIRNESGVGCLQNGGRTSTETLLRSRSVASSPHRANQARHYSSSAESAPLPRTIRASSSRRREVPRVQSSRSLVAQEWYENALAGLEGQLVDQHESEYKSRNANSDGTQDDLESLDTSQEPEFSASPVRRAHSPSRQSGRAGRRITSQLISETPIKPRFKSYKLWQKQNAQRHQLRARSWIKSRWSATHAARARPEPIKWVHGGYPIRLRTPQKPSDVTAFALGENADPEHTDPTSSGTTPDQLGYTIPEQVFRWNRCFARLKMNAYSRATSKQPHEVSLGLDPKAAEFAHHILNNMPPDTHISTLEEQFGLRWREIWLHAALNLLNTSPEDVPRFLLLTHIHSYPPSEWINDCLQFLATHLSTSATPVPRSAFDQLVDTLCTLSDRPGSTSLLLKGSVVRLLLTRCTKEQVLRIHDCILDRHAKVHWNTLLHLSSSLARYDCFDQALDALLHSTTIGADVRSPQFESTCATILRGASGQPDGLRVSLRIIQNLADLGVKLNVQHCNIVMLNAVESGDLKSAFDVYHSLVDHGLVADQYTHAILLKGCKSSVEDSETLNVVIRQAIHDMEVVKSPVVAAEILHCLYLHHFRVNPDHAFSTVAEAYVQLFDATSLIRMRVLPADCQGPSGAALRIRPTLSAIGIMISAYLQDLTHRANTQSSRQQYELYTRVRRLAEKGIQPWSTMASHDYLANSFLLAFTSHASTLAHAAEVIRDMQNPLPPLPESPDSTILVDRKSREPSVRSWSIFLHGFAKHKKMDLAEQVMKYMRDKGMVPNQVTWNSLIGGYASARKVDGAVRAFREMQTEGLRGNEVTSKVMRNINVDAGILSQGDEVRDLLRTRIDRVQVLSEEESAVGMDADAADENGEDSFWESAQSSPDDDGED